MMRVTLYLRDAVLNALAEQAEREHRDAKRQAEVNIERELQRVGLLPADQSTPVMVQPMGVQHAQQ